MGSYLVIGEKENNSKKLSCQIINLLREMFPDKRSLFDGERVFALTKEEVAEVHFL